MKAPVSFLSLALASFVTFVAPLAAQVAPAITTQPDALTIVEGDYVYFYVVANGSEPLSYRWRKNGSDIAFATDMYYAKDPGTVADAADYTVKVSNSSGAVTSVVATLTVLVPPGITTQPLSKTAIIGSNVTFTVKATGSAPLNYQWFLDDVPIAGATSTNLTLLDVQPDDEGNYTVVVNNLACDYGADAAVSAAATLTVLVPPSIVDHPDNAEVTAGEFAIFSVLAEGTDTETSPLTYQWRFNGDNLSGQTDAVLELYDVLPANAGNYSVRVVNAGGSVISSNAYLTVNTPPVFTLHPVSRTVYPGSNTVLTALASGTAPIAYQWYFNESPLEGATNSACTIFVTNTSQRGYYSVFAENVAGEAWSDDAYLTVRAESVKPSLGFFFPTEGMRWSNSPMTVLGFAADNAMVDSVLYLDQWVVGSITNPAIPTHINSNTITWTNWSAIIDLKPGTNLVAAKAIDDSGNNSNTEFVRYFYVVPSSFTLVTNGPGTASTNLGSILEIGKDYTLTALPGPGSVFTNWTGGYTSTNVTLKFMMQSNLVLNMNFVDVQNPTITVVNPLPSGSVSSAQATLTGTAADNWRVASVWYQFNSDTWTSATGTSNWSVTVTLVAGTNRFSVYSKDAAGRVSPTNSTTSVVILAPPRPVVTGIARSGDTANISFTTVNGLTYNLEYKDSLTGAVWNALSPSASGTGGIVTLPDTNTPSASRYYRVRGM